MCYNDTLPDLTVRTQEPNRRLLYPSSPMTAVLRDHDYIERLIQSRREAKKLMLSKMGIEHV